jgi:hypothetical protein
MKNTIILIALVFHSAILFANEGQSYHLKLADLDVQLSTTPSNIIRGGLLMNGKLTLKGFCGCDDQYLQAMSLNDAYYQWERQNCITFFGNTSAGINCQTIALQNWSLTDQSIYSQWNECNRRCVVP